MCSRRGEEGLETWEDIRIYLNDLLGKNNSTARTYQHIYKEYLDNEIAPEVAVEAQKAKYQLQDVKREYAAMIRNESRLDNLMEAVRHGLKDIKPLDFTPVARPTGDNYMVVVASDWHIGSKHKNFRSEYSVEIATKRVMTYAEEVVLRARKENAGEILILNLNDLIEGNIHLSTRIQAEMDAIQQSIYAGKLFARFINYIAVNTGCKIKVGKVLDNHSRINKNKKEHIEAESFGFFVDFIAQERCKGSNVAFIGNPVDNNVGFTQFGGKEIAWVHGHLDTPARVKSSLEALVGINIDIIFMAHRHHVHITDNIVQAGSLKGTDEYAFDKRLFSKASQTTVVFNDREISYHNTLFE